MGTAHMSLSRRTFLQSTALAAAASAVPMPAAHAQPKPASGAPSPVKLGLASYTFRNFPRSQVIAWMKQLNLTGLNAKDAKDHLPMDPAAETQAISDYEAAGIHLHAAGTVYFPKD
jgi:hypothetical protein